MSDTLTSAPLLGGAVTVRGGTVQLGNADALASAHMDALVHIYARWVIWELGQLAGVRPSSIHDLYIGRGE